MILFCDSVKQLPWFWWEAHFPFYICKMLATSGPGNQAAEKPLTGESSKHRTRNLSQRQLFLEMRRECPSKAQFMQSRARNQPLAWGAERYSRKDELCVNFTPHWIVSPGRERKLGMYPTSAHLLAHWPLCFYAVVGASHHKLILPAWVCMEAKSRNSGFLPPFLAST